MGADDARPPVHGIPRAECAAHVADEPFEAPDLLLEEPSDMDAGGPPGPPEGDDLRDLGQCQAEQAGVAHERQQVQHVGRVDAIA